MAAAGVLAAELLQVVTTELQAVAEVISLMVGKELQDRVIKVATEVLETHTALAAVVAQGL
jgi:hypothetical protein